MRIIKWVFVGLAAVVLGLAMLWVLIPKERIINFALAQVQAQTGRAVRVDGDSDLRVFPNIAVVADQISVANADWSDRGPMLSADRLDVSISAIALLRGDIVMSRMTLIRPEILLERHANGSANWDLGADDDETPEIADASDEQSKPESTSPDIPIIEIPIAELIDGQLRFVDYGTGQDITLSAITAEVRVPALDQPITFVGELTYGARPIMASLSTQFPSELGPDTQVPISAEISVTEAGTLSFEGFASLGGDVSGQFDVDLSSTQAFLSAFDVVATGLSKNLGAQIDASTNLSFDGALLSMSDLIAVLGDNQFSGGLNVALLETPFVSGALDVGTLDLRTAAASSSASSTTNASRDQAASGWPDERLDLGALGFVNADVAITGDALITDSLRIDGFSANLGIDAARAVFSLDQVNAYQGAGAGEFILNARQGLSTAVRFQGNGVELQPLMSDMLDVDSIQGRVNMNLDLLGTGTSMDGIMKSLRGTAQFDVQTGRWTGVNLDSLLRSGDTAPGTTVFDNLSGSATVQNGVAVNDNLIFSLPSFETRGAGEIDIGQRHLDYTLTPNAKTARAGDGLAIPVRIHGLWGDPKIQPDLNAAVNLNFAEEKKALEAKAKERIEAEKKKLEERAKQALGDALPDVKNVEDALKKELEKGAAGGLLKLLGNN